ncbi:MAG TPA: NAD(P)/FAD-dependent oxidoreductase [Chloroflexia bacterium]|nr:NAD(P)/FAD-dependent oxidoreductase [Chloroflexia bacterium]
MKIVIVGAGVAGLVCGRTLQRAGHEVIILEASDAVGGRVRSDNVEGFTLERGFQVLFTAYPAAQRQLEYSRLALRAFQPGAIISKDGKRYVLSDPVRDPSALVSSALAPVVHLTDKVRTGTLAFSLIRKSIHEIITGPDETTEEFLRRSHFSSDYINNFIRPFFGGVYLDNSMNTSAKCFKFDFKMLSQGQTVIPAGGMGKISEQLAEGQNIRFFARVAALLKDNSGRYYGARLEDGEEITGDAVVVSTPAPEAARLTGKAMPEKPTSTINLYYSGSARLYEGKKLVLNANSDPFINNCVLVSNISPEHAPEGQHLLSATILGVPDATDDELYQRGMVDLRRIFQGDSHPEVALSSYRPLAIYRIPFGQFAQPPGIHPTLPDNDSGEPGLYFAAEFTEASSLNAAMVSGEKAAALIQQRLPALAR